MNIWELILAIITAAFASTGFWSFILYKIQKRDKSKDALTRLMLGMAHDRIMQQSAKFIQQGYRNEDEYGDFIKYLYDPYIELGGDGTAEEVVEHEVKKLPFKIKGGENNEVA